MTIIPSAGKHFPADDILFLLQLVFTADLCRQHMHLPMNFISCDFGVNLRRGDFLMPHHLRHRFYRHALCQTDGRSEGMTGRVSRETEISVQYFPTTGSYCDDR